MALPDGTTAEETAETGEAGQAVTEPGTPEEQITTTVTAVSLYETVSQAMAPVLGLFGAPPPSGYTTGGGGRGGAYMFASLDELDGVIGQWQDLIDEIKTDQGRVEAARGFVAEPAADKVSGRNSVVSGKVVAEMRRHNEQLLVYAERYVVKLKECRTQMATTEDGTRTSMDQVH